MDETATVSQKAVSLVPDGYVRAGLQPGETLSVLDLMRVLLIPSANDAAFVLAEHVGGSVKRFAALCNKRAKALGCEKLHFVNPNGIHDADHYCTAYDLFLIAKACSKFDVFNEIVTQTSCTLPATNAYGKSDRTFRNTNQLLSSASPYYYFGCTGIKTGFTNEAGQCLVAGYAGNGLSLISVVLGGAVRDGVDDRFADTVRLFDFVSQHYAVRLIADHTKRLAQVTVKKATKDTKTLDVVIQSDIEAVSPLSLTSENVPTQINLPDELRAPIAENEVLGRVTYRVDGLIYETALVASHAVEKLPYWLYNLLVLLALAIVVALALFLVQRRKEERRKQELLRRRRLQMQRRRQAQQQQDNRFRP